MDEINSKHQDTFIMTDDISYPAISLYEHLKQYGFDDAFFGKHIRGTRMTVVKDKDYGSYESAIEPVEEDQRSKGRVIPVSRFLQLGDMLKFSNAMRFKVPPPATMKSLLRQFPKKPFTTIITSSLAAPLWAIGKILALNLNQMSYIEGWVCEHKNPPFLTFPFDEWLTVHAIATTWLDLYSPDGHLWRLGTVVLTDPEEINFRHKP